MSFIRFAIIAVATFAVSNGVHAQGSMLRVVCDGENLGAEITVNGAFKGECPLDMQVPPGEVRVKAVKKAGAGRERQFEQQFRLGDGVVKRLEVVLGTAQLTTEGRRLEEARLARELEERNRAAAEKRRLDAIAEAEARVRIDKRVDDILALRRAQRSSADPALAECPDCPETVTPLGGRPGKVALPSVDDAETAGWVKLIEPELNLYLENLYLDSAAAYFRLPSNVVPWPCEGAEATIRSLIGFVSLADLPADEIESFKRQLGAGATYYFRDIRLWPVQASCKDGKLDGEIDVWAFGIEVTDFPESMFIISPNLRRIRFAAADGQPAGLVRTLTRSNGNFSFLPGDKDTAAKFKGRIKFEEFSLSYGQPAQPGNPRAVEIVYSTYEDQRFQELNVSETPATIFTLPLSPGRTQLVTFAGQRKASRMLFKDGKLHGETVMYARRVRTGAFTPYLQYPAAVQCWRDGVLITTVPCPAQ